MRHYKQDLENYFEQKTLYSATEIGIGLKNKTLNNIGKPLNADDL